MRRIQLVPTIENFKDIKILEKLISDGNIKDCKWRTQKFQK